MRLLLSDSVQLAHKESKKDEAYSAYTELTKHFKICLQGQDNIPRWRCTAKDNQNCPSLPWTCQTPKRTLSRGFMILLHKRTETRRKKKETSGKYQKDLEFLVSSEISQRLSFTQMHTDTLPHTKSGHPLLVSSALTSVQSLHWLFGENKRKYLAVKFEAKTWVSKSQLAASQILLHSDKASLAHSPSLCAKLSFIFTAQTWEWYQYSHLTLGKKAYKHISQNVKVFLKFIKAS